MRFGVGLAAALALLPIAVGATVPTVTPVVRCIESAATAYRLPPAVVLILLSVEGGSLGRVSRNSNGTVDIGPMQVNTIWLPVVARHWGATPADTYAALRDNFCANVEAGTWILRQAMDQAHGDFWEGVGFYHSHDPGYEADYLRKVLRQALRLQAQALREAASKHATLPGS
ncbi:MAG: lytic transglycosylase domain-containing protein [Pseudomonadota bacterium]|nr:lytic transglycosylase domain-containing protein [Pseudomonadota bacterium]